MPPRAAGSVTACNSDGAVFSGCAACTNKPSDSTYTDVSTTGPNCSFVCDAGFYRTVAGGSTVCLACTYCWNWGVFANSPMFVGIAEGPLWGNYVVSECQEGGDANDRVCGVYPSPPPSVPPLTPPSPPPSCWRTLGMPVSIQTATSAYLSTSDDDGVPVSVRLSATVRVDQHWLIADQGDNVSIQLFDSNQGRTYLASSADGTVAVVAPSEDAIVSVAAPEIASSSGPCLVEGNCVCSSNFHTCTETSGDSFSGSADNYEECSVTFTQPATLSSSYFQTEACCDKMTVNGNRYSGSTSPNGVVASSLTWSSDYSVLSGGFKVCLSALPFSARWILEEHAGPYVTIKSASASDDRLYLGADAFGTGLELSSEAGTSQRWMIDCQLVPPSPPLPPPPPPATSPSPPPSPPPGPPYIASVSGGCQYSQASASTYACVCSPNWVDACTAASTDGSRPSTIGQYNDSEGCSIKFTQPATLRVDYFSTESGYDKVFLNNVSDNSGQRSFTGTRGPDGEVASSMSWYTDDTVVNFGFKICLTAETFFPPPSLPPSPPPPSPPPSPPPPSPPPPSPPPPPPSPPPSPPPPSPPPPPPPP